MQFNFLCIYLTSSAQLAHKLEFGTGIGFNLIKRPNDLSKQAERKFEEKWYWKNAPFILASKWNEKLLLADVNIFISYFSKKVLDCC